MRLIDADILLGYVNKYDRGQPVGKALRAMLEKSPTVDAVPVKHGHWIDVGGYCCGDTEFACSVCGKTEWRSSINRFEFCPFCGARMDEVDE